MWYTTRYEHARFTTAREFAQALRRSDEGLSTTRVLYPLKRSRQNFLLQGLIGLLLLLLGVVMGMLLTLSFDGEDRSFGSTPQAGETTSIDAPKMNDKSHIIYEPKGWGWFMESGSPRQDRLVEDASLEDLDDEPRWVHYPEEPGGTGLVGGDGYLAFATGNLVYALDWRTGDVMWETFLGANVEQTPVLVPDPDSDDEMILIVPTENGDLYGLSLADATLLWHLPADELGGVITGGVTVGFYDMIYIPVNSGKIHAIYTYTGEIDYEFDLTAEDEFFPFSPTVTDKAIFVAGSTERVYAFSP